MLDPSVFKAYDVRGVYPTELDEQGAVKVTVSTPTGERYWYQHVPAAYDGATPWPLVVDFHGYAEGAAIQRQVSGFEALGDDVRVEVAEEESDSNRKVLG